MEASEGFCGSSFTCCCRSEWLYGLHKRDRNVSHAYIPQDYVDTKHKWHRKNSSPLICGFDHDEWFKFENFNYQVCTNSWAYEVHARYCQRKFKLQFLQRWVEYTTIRNNIVRKHYMFTTTWSYPLSKLSSLW